MTDKEILEVLKEMLSDYEAGLVFIGDWLDCQELILRNSTHYGFCKWLRKSIYCKELENIIHELYNDLLDPKRITQYWYNTIFNSADFNEIKEFVLLPRAKHLQRTIERIEKRILEDTTVIMPQQI